MNFYAHSKEHQPPTNWEPLFTPFGEGDKDCQGDSCEKCRNLEPMHGHLNKVAWWAGKFAAEMFPPESPESAAAREWGRLAGLWHDLGKFASEWQVYLKKKADAHEADCIGTIPHSTAGACHTTNAPPFGDLLAYLIAGHHAGLPDGAALFSKLKKPIPEWYANAKTEGVPLDLPIPMPPLTRPDAGNDGLAFLLRFLFSCLVDADFIATEAFMQPERNDLRMPWPNEIVQRMLTSLETYLDEEFGNAEETDVNRSRSDVLEACANAAEKRPGFFSLTVPTGGGKTLSSLLFALRHAKKHGLRRVVYVIPFTSIITQNADVFRKAMARLSSDLGREIVLEHHSKFDPTKETEVNRLAAENWDAPLIVTTNVRFFESLFANRTSACRKLHNIARSVVIFDEAQAIPARLLHPILRAVTCLVKDLHSTAVLCTATQPALDRRDDFSIGIPPADIVPIVPDERELFQVLKRVEPAHLGPLTDEELISHILSNAENGALLIVNTTRAAQVLHESLSRHVSARHLSARMCPAHIMAVLDEIKDLRSRGKPVIVVSTQLVEAGVDISFPVVYRAECGLDSFAQAAGRCNRNGELKDAKGNAVPGRAFLFTHADHPIPDCLHDLLVSARITILDVIPYHREDLLSLGAIRTFFKQSIWLAGSRTGQWDEPGIVSGGMACFSQNASGNWAKAYRYKSAAEKFRLIDSPSHPIIIPWGEAGEKLAKEIRGLDRASVSPKRLHFRRAQPFTVQVYPHEWRHSGPRLSMHCDEAFAILEHPQNYYHPETGLKRPGAPDDPNAFYL